MRFSSSGTVRMTLLAVCVVAMTFIGKLAHADTVLTTTLWDETGNLESSVTAAEVSGWRDRLHSGSEDARQRALLHLRLGEWELAARQEPGKGEWHFRQAQSLVSRQDPIYGESIYNRAVALYWQCAYADSTKVFRSLLDPRNALTGFNSRNAVLWQSHAAACLGYHDSHAALGIPQPARLDPECGAAAVAMCRRELGLSYDKQNILANIRVSGRGSSDIDILRAWKKLSGGAPRIYYASDKALKVLPKPLIAFVEHDHFVAVLSANKKGVTYSCSDCGPWPGGRISLSWRQWQAMEASEFIAVAQPKTSLALGSPNDNPPVTDELGHIPYKSFDPSLEGNTTPTPPKNCGGDLYSLRCLYSKFCPEWHGGAGKGGATCGDPVNLATLEEELHPESGLEVYNPVGPSVSWNMVYNHMRGTEPDPDKDSEMGIGWSHPYNQFVRYFTSSSPRSLVMPNGACVRFERLSEPNGTVIPGWLTCNILTPGMPFTIEENLEPIGGGGYKMQWRVNYIDGSVWESKIVGYVVGSTPAQLLHVPFEKITDRRGKKLFLEWGTTFPGLSAIRQETSTGPVLLSIVSADSGFEVRDCYGRSIFYKIITQYTPDQLNEPGVPYRVLTEISQIVPTAGSSSATAPMRSQFSYVAVHAGYPYYLCIGTHTVPSPTGTGTETATIAYRQDGSMYVSSVTDANGNKTTFTKLAGNNTQVAILTPANVEIYRYVVGYNNQMSETSRTDGTNTHFIFEAGYTSNPRFPDWIKDGTGKQLNFQWDGYSRLLSKTSPRGLTTTYTYTSATGVPFSRLTNIGTPGVGTTTLNYIGATLDVSSVEYPSPTGSGTQVATFTYDALGNVTSVTSPSSVAGQTITRTFSYTTDGPGYTQSAAIGQPVAIQDATGATVSHLRYDSQGNLISAWDGAGRAMSVHYNIANQADSVFYPTAVSGPAPFKTEITYLYPDGPAINTKSYDFSGNVIRQDSPMLGKEGEVLGPNPNAYTAEPYQTVYDAAYRVKQLIHPDGTTTNYYYNTAGYLSEVDKPGAAPTNQEITYYTSYDGAGRLLEARDAKGLVTQWEYNTPEGLLTAVKFPDPQTDPNAPPTYTGDNAKNNATFSYDSYGRLATKTDGTGSVTIGYNGTSLPVTVDTLYNGVLCAGAPLSTALSMSYDYNPDGSRNSMTTPGGTFTYKYDTLGRLYEVRNPQSRVVRYTYKPTGTDTGELKSEIKGSYQGTAFVSSFSTGYVTDGQGRLTQLINRFGIDPYSTGTVIAQFGDPAANDPIAYDASGNRTRVATTLDSGAAASFNRIEQFAYNAKNRLTQHTNGTINDSFAYDAMGNATTFQNATGIGYNNRNQPTSSSFAYDANGDPTMHNGSPAFFDCLGNLTASGANIAASAPFQAGYSLSGQRVWKQGSTGATSRTYFLYDGTNPVCEFNSTGQLTAINSFGGLGLFGRATFAGGNITSPTSESLYVFDERGNVVERMTPAKSLQYRLAYKAYGAETVARTGGGATNDPWGFGAQYGYYRDKETNYLYCTFRYYDPNTGRWLNRDPIGFGGGLNLYGYCGQNPIMRTDPLGLIYPSDSDISIGGGFAGRENAGCSWDGGDTDEARMLRVMIASDYLHQAMGDGAGFGGFGGFAGRIRGEPIEDLPRYTAGSERVRHHTDLRGLKAIRESKTIDASETNIKRIGRGVDVEATGWQQTSGYGPLFGKTEGPAARFTSSEGAYIEFDLPTDPIYEIHDISFLHRPSRAYRIVTEIDGVRGGLDVSSLTPRFIDARPWTQKIGDFLGL